MKIVFLIVGLVLGFLGAAWFYEGGGALVIAGKQIGPDVRDAADFIGNPSSDFTSNSSGNTLGGAPGSTLGGGAGNTLPSGSSGFGTPSGSSGEKGAVNNPAIGASSTGYNTPPSSIGGNSFIQIRWPK